MTHICNVTINIELSGHKSVLLFARWLSEAKLHGAWCGKTYNNTTIVISTTCGLNLVLLTACILTTNLQIAIRHLVQRRYSLLPIVLQTIICS